MLWTSFLLRYVLGVLPVDSVVKMTLLETTPIALFFLHDVPHSSDQHRLRTKGMKRNFLIAFAFPVWSRLVELENLSACSVKPAIGAPLGDFSGLVSDSFKFLFVTLIYTNCLVLLSG